MDHIIIIGGGGTGAALAHDLVLRGFDVSLFEKGELLSGATGRHHGLLHSGARYAVHDPAVARECIQENKILRHIAPEAFEPNGGLFVALDDADLEYSRSFLESCRACGIPTRKLTPEQALTLEPKVNPTLKLAVQVPDASMDPWRLPMQFFATAKINGAKIHHLNEVIGLHHSTGLVSGVRVIDHRTHREYDMQGDLVVNATGAWAEKFAAMAGVALPVQPAPGVMLALNGRLTNMVINWLHRADEGDIIVPRRKITALGTTIWLTDDPEDIDLPQDHVESIVRLCGNLVPAVKETAIRSAWWAIRPLIPDQISDDPQIMSRTFECYDHKEKDGMEGLVSIIGGKATTLREMAEKTADLICRKTGRNFPCRTKTEKLLPYRYYYK